MKFESTALGLLAATLTLSCGQAFVVKSTTSFIRSSTTNLALVPPQVEEITDPACLDAVSRLKQVLVQVPDSVSGTGNVGISYVHWPAEKSASTKSSVPLVLVHGFDSSCLEYRRLGPQLAARGIDTYAVDLLGWGYTQLEGVNDFSANAKLEALKGFVQTVLKSKQVCIGGASLGGAAAIEWASANPEFCKGLILMDAQGLVDGVGPMASLPKPLAQLGVQVLKSVPLRSSANQMSYFDKETYATEDALKVGRLHCLREGWDDALVSFMLSGGFSPSAKVSTIESPSLVLWGRQDGILDGNVFANKFVETLPDAKLRWIEECGHVPHLEQPETTADTIAEFLSSDIAGSSSNGVPQEVLWGGLASATAVAVGVASNFN